MKNNVIQVDFVNRKRKGLIPILWVKSDNFEGYITNYAYRHLVLSMSTGDYNTHTKETRWFRTAEFTELVATNQITDIEATGTYEEDMKEASRLFTKGEK